MQTKDSVDLMNVEYADVLNLFRSLKKSESALKDKDKELTLLRNQVNQLKDSHGKFRGQLHTLESVKELTVSLQSQLTALQQENNTLVEENKELANLNLRAEELLKEKEQEEQNQARMLRSVQLDFATLKGRYEETLKAQKQLEIVVQNEQTSRLAIHNRLGAADETIAELTEQNKKLKRELETANHKLNQCDQELLHASEQLSSITKEVVNISSTKEALLKAEAEVSLLKGDMARLIHLFEYVGEGEEFFHHWGDSQGMSFVGTDLDEGGYNFDMDFDGDHSPHTHATPYHPQSSHHTHHTNNSLPLNATEYAHLKRLYGKDPFPLTNSGSMHEESEYWVPGEAAKLGVQFFTTKLPHVSTNIIMEFLRGMNKIWLRRERRKVKRVKEVLGGTIEDLKRQLNNLKPYKGVLAERQIRRLQSQLKTDRKKQLTGRPRSRLESATMDPQPQPSTPHSSLHSHSRSKHSSYFATEDLDPLVESGNVRRFCRSEQLRKSYEGQDRETVRISTEKLLEASLQSLEGMSVRKSTIRDHDSSSPPTFSQDAMDHPGDEGLYPSASYLRGALWLARNLALVVEELSEAMDQHRLRTMQDIDRVDEAGNNPSASASAGGGDQVVKDLRRALHRLRIVATGSATQACALTDKTKSLIRNIIKGASELSPGRSADYQQFLATLPIESALFPAPHSSAAHPAASQSLPGSPRRLNESRATTSPYTSKSMRLSALLDTPLYSRDVKY